jgi:hypothetical protein
VQLGRRRELQFTEPRCFTVRRQPLQPTGAPAPGHVLAPGTPLYEGGSLLAEPWQLTLYWVYCSSLTLQLPIRCCHSDVDGIYSSGFWPHAQPGCEMHPLNLSNNAGGVVQQVSGSNGAYTVTLSGSSYKGFLVQTNLGTFNSFPSGTKAKSCSTSAWTHSSSASKTSKTASLTVSTSGTATLTYLVVRLSHALTLSLNRVAHTHTLPLQTGEVRPLRLWTDGATYEGGSTGGGLLQVLGTLHRGDPRARRECYVAASSAATHQLHGTSARVIRDFKPLHPFHVIRMSEEGTAWSKVLKETDVLSPDRCGGKRQKGGVRA